MFNNTLQYSQKAARIILQKMVRYIFGTEF
jgi:hypothetical protein